jgi:predicted MPP superfamily phosphohydrolase
MVIDDLRQRILTDLTLSKHFQGGQSSERLLPKTLKYDDPKAMRKQLQEGAGGEGFC